MTIEQIRILREAELKLIRGALWMCEEYLDNKADVRDGDYGEPIPNEEMALAQEVREALAVLK